MISQAQAHRLLIRNQQVAIHPPPQRSLRSHYLAVVYHHFHRLIRFQTLLCTPKWLRRFENLFISLCETDPVVKRGLLLTYASEATNDIFETLPNTGTDYQSAVQIFNERFDTARNKDTFKRKIKHL